MLSRLNIFNSHWHREFFATESSGGILMLLAAAAAIVLTNSPASGAYMAFIAAPITPHMNLGLFVNDVLMAIFFLAVGMELKYEMREGALARRGQKTLPLIAALGGVITPALLYLGLTYGDATLSPGWAIPTATDIAFALCVLRLVGGHIPQSAKMFLLAIAIYDDLAAILIIAIFYSSGLAWMPLAEVCALTAILFFMNRFGVARLWLYLLVGCVLWFAIHHAGIHPTVAGVITGLMIPLHRADGKAVLKPFLHRLHPYVAFGILPIFAFATAGVDLRALSASDALGTLPLAIALGLLIGKPLGISAATFLAVKLRFATLPEQVTPRMLIGIAATAGIGFTMSLFIGQLAFADAPLTTSVKLGVIAGSVLSAGMGMMVLRARK